MDVIVQITSNNCLYDIKNSVMDYNNKKLLRSKKDKVIGGICGGLGKYLEIDSTVIRVLYAILTLFTAFSGILLYIILLFIIPIEEE